MPLLSVHNSLEERVDIQQVQTIVENSEYQYAYQCTEDGPPAAGKTCAPDYDCSDGIQFQPVPCGWYCGAQT